MNINEKTRDETQAQLQVARQFCIANLQECCAELVERTQTGVLDSGRVRELAKLCTFPGLAFNLSLAEKIIADEAMRFVAEARPAPPVTFPSTGPSM